METSSLQATLRDAGLSKYQAEAYTTLLDLGTASATELAEASSVPSARIYDVLRELESRAYIETYEQESLQARARDPEILLSELRERAEKMEAAAEEITDRWEAPPVESHRVSIVKRFETVIERAREAIEEADHEVQVAVTPEQYEELRPALRTAYANGALVNVSVTTDVGEGERCPPSEAFEGVATEVRLRTLPTPFVALVDRSISCFAPHHRSINEYGVLVDDRTLAYVFHWYFRTTLWEVWEQVYSVRSSSPPQEFGDLRRCVREMEPMLDGTTEIIVSGEGIETETGELVEFEGRVVDIVYAGTADTDGEVPISQLAGRVTLTVETPDGTHLTIGGRGAVIEEIEAIRVVVESIDSIEEPPGVPE